MTRVLSLYGARPTGVSRVCLAYLQAICNAEELAFGLVRTPIGYLLLDKTGMQKIRLRLEGKQPWAKPDLLSRLLHKASRHNRVTEAECRRLCLDRSSTAFLGRMLRRHLPAGTIYLNVGQSNMPTRLLRAVKTVPDARITTFLHDTIPLDHPDLQTPESVERFRKFAQRARNYSDVILTNSHVSAENLQRHLSRWGEVPRIIVAHLGVDDHFFQIGDNEWVPPIPSPYFLCLGTIEPRKNHAFLLDLWEELETELPKREMPHLVICGRRGWKNEEVFRRLDESPQRGCFLHEFNDLEDYKVEALLGHAAGTLFPSVAEGFGLPPLESAAKETPVICNDLPVFREFLRDIPIYVSVTDSYAWKKAIIDLARQSRQERGAEQIEAGEFLLPDWQSHFNVVLKVT